MSVQAGKDFPVAVMLSGAGTTLEAILKANADGLCRARPTLVLSDRQKARGLKVAQAAGIPARALPRRDFQDQAAHEGALAEAIDASQAHWVVLAGYMRILGGDFVRAFAGRMLNTHPSLLPAHRGLNTYQRALDANDTMHGCSVHFVTEDLDGGPVIAQAEVPIQRRDTAAELEQRTRARERRLYPMVLELVADGRIGLDGSQPTFDGKVLERPLRLPWNGEELE
ncbi:phosphoribosylglycinamide formyltransferase [Gammaproteobacteria bacterium AB-CW1]|uniref:Phosphoribosylglycinamide formyltransferase n=1 Tax=Natronospira elongata TaxID=3110268 RepID=A0AAP6JDZ9_9GAMM|nr:phosphoribosylglycinamide formyltransferase [Gammaproteobacteria bacterium AB-CW1]